MEEFGFIGSGTTEQRLRSMCTFCWSGVNVTAAGHLGEDCGVQAQRPGPLHTAQNVPAVLGRAMALGHGTPGFSRNHGLISSSLPTMLDLAMTL